MPLLTSTLVNCAGQSAGRPACCVHGVDRAPSRPVPDPPLVGDERMMLQARLDYQRQTLLYKCRGLSGEELRRQASPPSSLSLLGLVRHMSEVERSWFRRRIGGDDVAFLYSSEADPDGEFDHVDLADAEADFATFREELVLADAARPVVRWTTPSFTRIGRP